MSSTAPRICQLVDWRAAIWAGIISGVVFLLLNLFFSPSMIGGNAWVMVRLFASLIMREGILAPPATFHLSALLVAILTNFSLSLLFALLVAYVIHRGGLVTGILGGAALGLAIYGINFYTVTYFVPWFFAVRGWVMVFNHIIIGALAGGIYEWLEVERCIAVTDESSETRS
jgi:hypothetical protein